MGTKRAEFRFYAELNDFLPRRQRFVTVVRLFEGEASVKDLIEAAGVPHTEVDLVIANSESVDFTYRVRDGDRIAVYPVFEALDIGPIANARPVPLREPRFFADVHLGRLARHLRLLGFDTAYERECDDTDLAATAAAEGRIILTRDVGLLKRNLVTHGLFVRAHQPRAQLLEVARRLQLVSRFKPFTRCLACNGALTPVSKEEVAAQVPERAWQSHEQFVRCTRCARVYWAGTHHERLRRLVKEIQIAAGNSR
ncbi:MAG TPA: Mut7-C RNAse domain-containing protein [Vicinamibacterales bacterium]|nr:Mut7-C RNAse domain-containing protein [Vicinamibacterales bacterium]